MDDLAQVRVLLQEQEAILENVAREKPDVTAELQRGKQLSKDPNAPDFLHETVTDIDERVRDVGKMASIRVEQLRQGLRDWETWENGRKPLKEFLALAEQEVAGQSVLTGEEAVQKELVAKQDLVVALNDFRPQVEKLRTLGERLRDTSSIFRQRELAQEVAQTDAQIENLTQKLQVRVDELTHMRDKWTQFEDRLKDFSKWATCTEDRIKSVRSSETTPDQQLEQSKSIKKDISEKQADLEELERLGGELASSHRSRDAAAMRSKLANQRRAWQGLTSKANDMSAHLSRDVNHWESFQNLVQLLLPWLDTTERQLAGDDVIQTSNCDEALAKLDGHLQLQRDVDEKRVLCERALVEAGHVSGQPQVKVDSGALRSRMRAVEEACDDRATKLRGAQQSWTAFTEARDQISNAITSLLPKLSDDPHSASVDVDFLTKCYADAKTKREHLRVNASLVTSLDDAAKDLEPHLTAIGAGSVYSDVTNLKQDWEDLVARCDVRAKQVGEALHECREFWEQWNEFERWLSDVETSLKHLSDVYVDDVRGAIKLLETLDADCRKREPTFVELSTEVERLRKACKDDSEREHLLQQHNDVRERFNTVYALNEHRLDLCLAWAQFLALQSQVSAHRQALQQRMRTQNFTQNDVTEAEQQLDELQAGVDHWKARDDEMQVLSKEAGGCAVKSRSSQNTLNFRTEVLNLEKSLETLRSLLEARQGKLDEITDAQKQFEDALQDALASRSNLDAQFRACVVSQCELTSVKEHLKQLKTLEAETAKAAQITRVKDVGRKLTSFDPTKRQDVQKQIAEAEAGFTSLQDQLCSSIASTSNVVSAWQLYADDVKQMRHTLDQCAPAAQDDVEITSMLSVKQVLDRTRVAEQTMKKQQRQHDLLNSRAQHLVKEAILLPSLDVKPLKQEMEVVNMNWKNCLHVRHGAFNSCKCVWL